MRGSYQARGLRRIARRFLDVGTLELLLCSSADMRQAILLNGAMVRDHRSPDHASRLGLKHILVTRLEMHLERVCLLASMRLAAAGIGETESAKPWGDA